MKRLKSLSVFFLAYNEEANIRNTVEKALKIIPKIASKWEVIVVNDGSTDNTAAIVERMVKKEPRIRMISHSPNRGYGAALTTGFYGSRYEWIAFTDGDGQYDFADIKKFLPHCDRADAIIGYRVKRADNFYRQLLPKILGLANLILFGLKVKDVDCGFKLLKKEVLIKIGKPVTESAITETEIIVRIKRAGFRIVEVGVTHLPREEGQQTGGKFKVIFKAAKEGLALWWALLKEKKK